MSDDRAIDALCRDLSPSPPLSRRRPGMIAGFWTLTYVAAVAALSVQVLGLRADLANASAHAVELVSLALGLVTVLAAARLAFLAAIPGRAPTTPERYAPGVLFSLTLASLGVHHLNVGLPLADGMQIAGLRCALAVVLLAVLPGVGIFVALRKLAPVNAADVARNAGLAAGLVGALGVGLHCEVELAMHLLVYHGLPVLALVGVAILAGRRLLRW